VRVYGKNKRAKFLTTLTLRKNITGGTKKWGGESVEIIKGVRGSHTHPWDPLLSIRGNNMFFLVFGLGHGGTCVNCKPVVPVSDGN